MDATDSVPLSSFSRPTPSSQLDAQGASLSPLHQRAPSFRFFLLSTLLSGHLGTRPISPAKSGAELLKVREHGLFVLGLLPASWPRGYVLNTHLAEESSSYPS